MPAPRLDGKAWGLLCALSLVWGGSFFFAEIALAGLPPFTIVLARLAIGAAGLWLLLAIAGVRPPAGLQEWRDLAIMGLLNNAAPFALIVWGQQWITGGLASVLNGTTPVFGVVAAHFLTADEKLTANRLAGVAIGVAGVAVLVGPSAPAGPFGSGGYLLGCAAVLAAAASYAAAGLWGRRLRHLPPVAAAAGQVGCSTVLVLPLALALERPWRLAVPAPEVWGALAGIGLLSTSLAYVLFFAIVRRAGGGNVMLVTLMIPPSAVLLGALFLGEAVGAAQLLGMALVAAALLAIDGRFLRAFRRNRG